MFILKYIFIKKITSFGIEWETNVLICSSVECINGWREYKKRNKRYN